MTKKGAGCAAPSRTPHGTYQNGIYTFGTTMCIPGAGAG